ncbi:MAG: hypothetical protein PWQ82_1533 [Thermosediminibacterales bacterium]|nr:hypothetical protein [Thermosediminibacterales bacterium]
MTLKFLTRTAVLLALTLAFQMFKLPQLFTGPAVNTMLFVSGGVVGIGGGVLIGALTPWIAFVNGILPAPLAPAIPFIMLGNAALVAVFVSVKRLNNMAAIILAAVIKFLILSTAVRMIINVPPKIATMLQLPQLYTALAGGVISFVILKMLEKPLGLNKQVER